MCKRVRHPLFKLKAHGACVRESSKLAACSTLALHIRRRGIRVEAASTAPTMGAGLKTTTNAFIDLTPLLAKFERL